MSKVIYAGYPSVCIIPDNNFCNEEFISPIKYNRWEVHGFIGRPRKRLFRRLPLQVVMGVRSALNHYVVWSSTLSPVKAWPDDPIGLGLLFKSAYSACVLGTGLLISDPENAIAWDILRRSHHDAMQNNSEF